MVTGNANWRLQGTPRCIRGRRAVFGWSSALAACLLVMPIAAVAQQSNGSTDTQPAPADAAKKNHAPPAKPAAAENPFPQDQSQHAAQPPASDQQAPKSAPDAPAATSGDAATENPFPEDVSSGAAKAAESNTSSGDGSSTSASSGSSSSSSSGSADAGADPDPAAGDVPAHEGRRRLRKQRSSDIQTGSLAGEGRAADDVKVGQYYLTTHNYQGAHLRFEEAARMDPANLEAIYGLAASADGLHNKDEALANYKLYLQVAPDGDRAKLAEKALKSLAK